MSTTTETLIRRKATWQMTPAELARVVADHQGWYGNTGGWINTADHRPIVQGWDGLADVLTRARIIRPGRGIDWRRLDSTISGGTRLGRVVRGTSRAYPNGRAV